jgi:hypothetical protein
LHENLGVFAVALYTTVILQEITHLHIRCAECNDPAVDLCGECFGKGSTSADIPNHKPQHAYRVVDHLPAITLFDKDWNAKEELLLLDGIDMYGLGNWRYGLAAILGVSLCVTRLHARAYCDA